MQVLNAVAAVLTVCGLSGCADVASPDKPETALLDHVVFLNTSFGGAGEIYSLRINGS